MEKTCCFIGRRRSELPWGSDESDLSCINLKNSKEYTIKYAEK